MFEGVTCDQGKLNTCNNNNNNNNSTFLFDVNNDLCSTAFQLCFQISKMEEEIAKLVRPQLETHPYVLF